MTAFKRSVANAYFPPSWPPSMPLTSRWTQEEWACMELSKRLALVSTPQPLQAIYILLLLSLTPPPRRATAANGPPFHGIVLAIPFARAATPTPVAAPAAAPSSGNFLFCEGVFFFGLARRLRVLCSSRLSHGFVLCEHIMVELPT